jgi:hypothetical protein
MTDKERLDKMGPITGVQVVVSTAPYRSELEHGEVASCEVLMIRRGLTLNGGVDKWKGDWRSVGLQIL